jgi:EAL domain-containing protein (putative c-di-GMP-specific phosphodiesterase class I)
MDPQDDAIVRSIVTLASDLGMQVVAEGIETAEQLQILRGLVCDYGQGYYFSRPLPGPQAEAFVTPAAGMLEPAAIRALPARGDMSIAS